MRKRTILLTGGSGVLGRALVDELVEDFDLICVRHRKPIADLRVGTVVGDLSRADLGLPPADLDRLLRRVDVVLHSAANTSWRASREEIFATNVGGTTTMLGLAERAQAPIYFMSTAFVARAGQTGAEERFGGAAAYLASKIEAEQLLRDSGLPGAILRPSVVIGDSRDGRMSSFQGFSKAAAAVVQGTVPVVPADPGSLIDAVPQDLVARATAALIRERVSTGEFWLTAGEDALVLRDLVETCLDFAAELGLSPDRPRLVPIEMVDRLLLPLLEGAIPPVLRRRFREYAELLLLFQSATPMESSLPELGFAVQTRRPALTLALRRTLEYWAARQGLLPAAGEFTGRELAPVGELVA
jgi:nucleoside-diphosphate-sugar epimerase